MPLDTLPRAVARATADGRPARVPIGGLTVSALAEAAGSGWDGVNVRAGEVEDRDHNTALRVRSWRGEWGRPGIADKLLQSEATVQGIRLVRRAAVAAAGFDVLAASDQPRDVEVAEFVRRELVEGRAWGTGAGLRTWLADASDHDLLGASYYEWGLRRRRDTGRVHLDFVEPRPLRTVDRWLARPSGWAMQQYQPLTDATRQGFGAAGPVIEPESLLALRWADTSTQPEPVPMLRPVYGPALRREIAQKARTHGQQRYSYAVPHIEIDPTVPGFDPSEKTQAAARRIASSYRINLNAAVQMPVGYRLVFVEVNFSASGLLDSEMRDAREIAYALGAGWYTTGWDNGTETLYREQYRTTFIPQLQANVDGIAEAIARRIVPALVRANFGAVDLPRVVPGTVRAEDPLELATRTNEALRDGALVDVDGEVEAAQRRRLSLPAMPPEVAARRAEGAGAGPEQAPPLPDDEPELEPADDDGLDDDSELEPADDDGPDGDSAALSELLADRLASLEARAFGDVLTQRPDGSEATALEGVLRLSETAIPVDAAKARLVGTLEQWRARMVDDYAQQVAATADLESAGNVPVPRQRELQEAYAGVLDSAYRAGKDAVAKETERQRRNPELRQRIEAGLARPEPGESSALSELDLTPPKAAQDAARRALDVRASKPESQRGMTAVGLARARDLANGRALSADTVRRMASYFARHEVDKQGSTWGEQGKGWQAWHGWGGDPGRRWADRMVKRLDAGVAASEGCGVRCGCEGPHVVRWSLADLAGMGHAINGVAVLAEAPEPDESLPESVVDSIDPEASVRTVTATSVQSYADRIRRAVRQALQAASVGGSLDSVPDVASLVRSTVLGLSLGQEANQAQGDVQTLFGLGRVQQQRAEGVKRYQYTTMLESQRCEPCVSHDLEIFPADQLDVYATPATWCLGGDKCNCVNIGIVS